MAQKETCIKIKWVCTLHRRGQTSILSHIIRFGSTVQCDDFYPNLAIIYVRPCMRSREKVCKSDKDALPICMIILTFGQLWFFKKKYSSFFFKWLKFELKDIQSWVFEEFWWHLLNFSYRRKQMAAYFFKKSFSDWNSDQKIGSSISKQNSDRNA